jgi:pilus assembly protein FimV
MYITCEQCSTIFQLDEKRLKPTGSKVRCSQCGNLFVAWPLASTQPGNVATANMGSAVASPKLPEDTFDQELDGIDLAELDSILERDRKVDSGFDNNHGDQSGDMAVDEADELDVADLDLDFESALALDDEIAPGAETAERQDEGEELDLDMDFDLEPAGATDGRGTAAQDQLLQNELDMDFELDAGSDLQGDAQNQIREADPGGSGAEEDIEMVLEDFEDVLSGPEEVDNDIRPSEVVAEEDLSLDMDLDLEEDTIPAEAQDQELELSLDDGDGLALDEEPATASADDLLSDVRTLDDEFDLTDLDDLLDEKEAQVETPEADEEIAFSLDEELEAETETAPAFELGKEDPATASAAVPGTGDDDLDLSGFDDLLADDHETEQPEPEELELSLDDGDEFELTGDTGFDLDEKTDTAAVAPADDAFDDSLDLGGLDSLLDDEGEQDDESQPEEMELSLDDDSDQMTLEEPVLEMASDEKADEELGEIEDLEFELDAEFEDKPVSKAAAKDQTEEADEADEEIDLSDIEKMLEDDTLVPEPSSQTGDLDLDMVGGAEKWVDDTADDLELESDGELDLTDIEAAIDDDDDSADGGIDDDQELELDLEPFEGLPDEQNDGLDLKLEMESDSSSADTQMQADDTEEIDLSDIDLSIEEEKPEIENEIIDGGDIELEFQIEEESAPAIIDSAETLAGSSHTTAAFGDTTAVAEVGDQDLIEEAFAKKPEIEKEVEKPKPVRKKKKGTSKSLVFILILALLGGGGYFGYDYAIKNNIEIPYLSNVVNYIDDFINPKPKDPNGIAMLSTLEINSKFIENEKAGRLFVVTGKVRNGYNVPCQMIHLQGKLFIKGKVLAKTEQSYAGVIISDSELASQGIGEIKQRLKSAGGQAAGLTVNPGQTLPFMVVFSELPADLDEFAIELLSSTKGQ